MLFHTIKLHSYHLDHSDFVHQTIALVLLHFYKRNSNLAEMFQQSTPQLRRHQMRIAQVIEPKNYSIQFYYILHIEIYYRLSLNVIVGNQCHFQN